jgi:hypothetical protein
LNAPPKARPVSDRKDPAKVYAFDADKGVLYASADAGASFTPRAGALPTGKAKLSASPCCAGELWLASERGLYRSVDAGARFERLDGPSVAEAVGFGKAAPGANRPSVFLVARIAGVHGVFRSDDDGAHWLRINDDAHRYGWIGQRVTGDPRVFGRVYLATNGRGIVWGELSGP